MKKNIKLLILIAIIILVIIGVLFLHQQNKIQKTEMSQFQNEEDIIHLFSPQPNELITGRFTIKGEARGSWFFEGTAPYYILSSDLVTVTSGVITAQGDWMTNEFVLFSGEVNFTPFIESGYLVLKNDNPSGLAEKNLYYMVPLKFQQPATMTVKVFFNNSKLDQEISCNKVFPVEREIVKTSAVARAALEELLKGVSEAEKDQGYFTSINPNVKINSIDIKDGIAYVDFDEQLEFQVGGSCRVSAIRAQITETLKQFPSINDVVISINSQAEDILQP